MATIANLYIKKDVLETIVKTLSTKKEKGISLDVFLSDEANDYGQDVSASVTQTKEQREAKAKKFYVGNGKTVWTDGKVLGCSKHEGPCQKRDSSTRQRRSFFLTWKQ